MSASDFFLFANNFEIDVNLAVYSIACFIFLIYLVFILWNSLKNNLRLLFTLLGMIINSTAKLVYWTGVFLDLPNTEPWSCAFATSADTFVHWMFCYTYLKLHIEVKHIFDRKIYSNNSETLKEINRDNCRLKIANAINITICAGLLAVKKANPEVEKQYNIGLTLQILYLMTWAISLCFLFTKFKETKRMLPNNSVFFIHGMLLGFYLLLNVAQEFAKAIPGWKRDCN